MLRCDDGCGIPATKSFLSIALIGQLDKFAAGFRRLRGERTFNRFDVVVLLTTFTSMTARSPDVVSGCQTMSLCTATWEHLHVYLLTPITINIGKIIAKECIYLPLWWNHVTEMLFFWFYCILRYIPVPFILAYTLKIAKPRGHYTGPPPPPPKIR